MVQKICTTAIYGKPTALRIMFILFETSLLDRIAHSVRLKLLNLTMWIQAYGLCSYRKFVVYLNYGQKGKFCRVSLQNFQDNSNWLYYRNYLENTRCVKL